MTMRRTAHVGVEKAVTRLNRFDAGSTKILTGDKRT